MIKLDKALISDEDSKRYIRHLNLSLIHILGQQRIIFSRILFIGAGGLASSSLLYLAASGVKTIGIVDSDSVDLSNLQRQIIHSEKSLGNFKVKSAKQAINRLNDSCKVRTYCCNLNWDNAIKIIKHYELVIDCTDNIKTRQIINCVCSILNLPYIYGAISQFTGQVAVFHFQNSLSYDNIVSQKNNFDNCNNNGVLSLLPGIIGLFQANEVIKIIVGIPTSLDKHMLVYESLQLKSHKIQLKKSKQDLSMRRNITNQPEHRNTKNIERFLSNKHLIIDIRDSYTSMMSPIQHAIKIPIHHLMNDSSLDFIKSKVSNHNIYIYCNSESKIHLAIKLLKQNNIIAVKY